MKNLRKILSIVGLGVWLGLTGWLCYDNVKLVEQNAELQVESGIYLMVARGYMRGYAKCTKELRQRYEAAVK